MVLYGSLIKAQPSVLGLPIYFDHRGRKHNLDELMDLRLQGGTSSDAEPDRSSELVFDFGKHGSVVDVIADRT